MTDYTFFDAIGISTDRLSGSNLIEASAGTGKTYSIALLVVRLIVEKNIPIDKILMVTFTNAAVEELQDRVRKFLVMANDFAEGEIIENQHIEQIINNARSKGVDDIKGKIKASLLLFDEANIVTIHSFCQQILNRYAFETGQLFGATLHTDISDIREAEINKFWRKNITTLPVAILELLDIANFKRSLSGLINRILSGRIYWHYNKNIEYKLDTNAVSESISIIKSRLELAEKNAIAAFNNSLSQIQEVLTRNPRSELNNLLDQPNNFIEIVRKGIKENKPKYVFKFPAVFLDACNDILIAEQELEAIGNDIKLQIKNIAAQNITAKIKDRMQKNSILTYNDLINNLHEVVMKDNGNELLINNIRNDFQAIFIDEFQDTDQIQFDIFRKLFIDSKENITFLIGDPKQSIYAFRGADVDAYLSAKSFVDNYYSMNTNYRSTQKMVDAANAFFLPHETFDTFFYSQSDKDGIRYLNVGVNENDGALLNDTNISTPLEIWSYENKDAANEQIVAEISQLLNASNNNKIKGKDKKERPIKPADIGILVRSGIDGHTIKLLLNELGIPAVQVFDDKVLQDDVAGDIAFILDAVLNPSRHAIHRALFTRTIGYTPQQLEKINEEKATELFRSYTILWTNESIFEMLSTIKKDFDLERQWLSKPGGQRVLANYIQIAQLLHRYQLRKGQLPEELLAWLKRSRQGLENEGDEYEMQIESDEEAVKIVTIHKSKGLEYNIVFCAHLSFGRMLNVNREYADFKHPETGFAFAESSLMNDDVLLLHEQQNEQENRRLMYVAITRAVCKCYIIFSKGRMFSQQNSSLAPFLEHLPRENVPILVEENKTVPSVTYNNSQKATIAQVSFNADAVSIEDRNWRRMSYSSLSLKGEPYVPVVSQNDYTDYDEFVFNTLSFGSHTGNMLHTLLENISFSNVSSWNNVVIKRLAQFSASNQEMYQKKLPQMIKHVMNASINFGNASFTLSNVDDSKTLRELEFNFLVSPIIVEQIRAVINEYVSVNFSLADVNILEGQMNGFIDLFFEYDDKYYVLDWKSNYLGNSLEAYSEANLIAAMDANNYHLQYLIYIVAAYKFLQSRIQNFDYDLHFGGVVYMFLRGVREQQYSGIFTARPDKALVEKLVNLFKS